MKKKQRRKLKAPVIGFIGQGFVGKSYADDFSSRGFSVVRYADDDRYRKNKEAIAACDIVFVAVPTPTTPAGFDGSIVTSVISLTKPGASVIVKSTLLPGYTKELQHLFPDRFLFHSPEFLSESTARYDAAHPKRNIIGMARTTVAYKQRARVIMSLLPRAPFSLVCDATEAEMIKYARNIIGYARVVIMNMLYDYTRALGGSWKPIQAAIAADPDNGPTYTAPVHKSGRGAGGRCFIKDMAAFARAYHATVCDDVCGASLLAAFEKKNAQLLVDSKKDLDLLAGVYGNETAHYYPKS